MGAGLLRLPGDGVFQAKIMYKNTINAAYGVLMLNANVINCGSGLQKQAGFCQKNRETGRFLSLKTTVKYNLRFFVNAGTVHFADGSPAETLRQAKNIVVFQCIVGNPLIFARHFAIVCVVEKDIRAGRHPPYRKSYTEENYAYSVSYGKTSTPDCSGLGERLRGPGART